jgi:Fic family protein
MNYREVLEWIDIHAADGRGRSLCTEETLKRLHDIVVRNLDLEQPSTTGIQTPSILAEQVAAQLTQKDKTGYRTKQVVVRSIAFWENKVCDLENSYH